MTAPIVQPGDTFSTRYESGCIAVTEPDEYGEFEALDSDGVQCSFPSRMVLPSTVRRPNRATREIKR